MNKLWEVLFGKKMIYKEFNNAAEWYYIWINIFFALKLHNGLHFHPANRTWCAVRSFPRQLPQVMIGSIFLLSLGLFFLTEQLKKRNKNFYYFENKGQV